MLGILKQIIIPRDKARAADNERRRRDEIRAHEEERREEAFQRQPCRACGGSRVCNVCYGEQRLSEGGVQKWCHHCRGNGACTTCNGSGIS